eukprot:TRINITY_DN10747_c0_g1_i1.p1 TRINITY_DN10747_c0_g1~~TRINITY_DN10747_c0_g1_i1.p1  ORF type:complete len:283 (-),score=45.49 TRINITY_DN10747_c0_g1_i1:373-1095(-)
MSKTMIVYLAAVLLVAGARAQVVASATAVSTPEGSSVQTYGLNGGQATATASGPKGKITCESPSGPVGTKVVCSGELPKNVTGALYIYNKMMGHEWCLKECEEGVDCGVVYDGVGQNVVLSKECKANNAWYFDEEAGLRLVYTTQCAAVNLDADKPYSFAGDVYIEEDGCEDLPAQWYFEGYQLKNKAFPGQCLTVCIDETDGCNTITNMNTDIAMNVAMADCVDSYQQYFIPEKMYVVA